MMYDNKVHNCTVIFISQRIVNKNHCEMDIFVSLKISF